MNDALNLRRSEVVQPGLTEMADQVLRKILVSLKGLRCQPPAGVLFEPIPNVLRKCRINLRWRLFGSGAAFHRNSERGGGRVLVGEPEFGDLAARNPAVTSLRARVITSVDPTVAEDQVRMTIILKDGRRLDKYIEHAIGSARNPMTDAQLEAKFKGLTESILPAGRASRVIDFCWNLEKAQDAAQLARLAAA